jgi:hypothetical protein
MLTADSFLAHPLGKKYAAIDVTMMLPSAIGSMTFQPNRINWSYRNRGKVARSQKNKNRKT